MTAHDNASGMEVGQFAELVAAVVRNIPRDISRGQAQRWISDSHALSLALCRALDESHQIFTLEVNYDQSVEEALKAGNYDLPLKSDLTSEHFPPSIRGGIETVEIHLVNFGRQMSNDEVTAELDKRGLRDGSIEELFALGATHSDLQRQFPIVARGSVWTDPGGLRHAPFLWSVGRHGWGAGLCWLSSDGWWGSAFHFAAVRK